MCIRTNQANVERIKYLEKRTGQSYEEYKMGLGPFPPKMLHI